GPWRRARGSTAARELVEGAELPVRFAFLVEERELVLVELAEELVPLDRLDVGVVLVVVPGKLDPQEAGIVLAAGAFHVRRPAAAFLDPATNLVVVRRLLGLAHRLDLRIVCKRRRSKIHATTESVSAAKRARAVPG